MKARRLTRTAKRRALVCARARACVCRSGDKIHPEDWGGRITELFPEYVGLPAVTEPPIGGEGQPQRNNPMWIRVYLRHDKIANAVSTPLKASLV